MANTFRSKEVYKKLRKEVHDRNTIVAVEGVYVSGQYRSPYYANMGITITDMHSNKATIETYEKANADVFDFDYALQLLDIDVNTTCPSISRYTKLYEDVEDFDYALQLFDIDVDPTCPTISKYNKIFEDVIDFDYALQLLDIDVNSSVPLVHYSKNNVPMTPEPILRITQINSNKATIENTI